MRTITSSVLPRFSFFLLLMAVGCASPESPKEIPGEKAPSASPLAGLPATFANTPSCEDCLSLTLTLRPDGAYLVRERVGASEFYDFGRWREAPDALVLEGSRDDPRRYAPKPPDMLDSLPGTLGGDLKRQPKVEALRGPFRVLGSYNGVAFRECRTGLVWPVGESRLGERLKDDFGQKGVAEALVAIDGRFEAQGGREVLVVQRPATLLTVVACPG
jgi:hypothetical protein